MVKRRRQFLDGTPIQGREVGFHFPKNKEVPFTFRVYIDEKSFTMTAPI